MNTFTSLSQNQIADIMRRFPPFELSYETISHKKVPEHYDLCIAIPQGKKAFLWYTFFRDQNVCFLMTLGRDKKVAQVEVVAKDVPCEYAFNTVIYGSLWTSPTADGDESGSKASTFFVYEDLYFYKGIPLARIPVSEKLGFLHDFLQNPQCNGGLMNKSMNTKIQFVLPVMWTIDLSSDTIIPKQWINKIPYGIHHLQYRCLSSVASYLNEKYNDKMIYPVQSMLVQKPLMTPQPIPIVPDEYRALPRFDYSKPQYKSRAVFEVKADLQYDIYHLYAYGKGSTRVYCGIMSIPSCKTSVFMNGLFRNIKENRNLDAIEESDDEDDFQDMRLDKYVDLNKTVAIECIFNYKFKRWTPIRTVQTSDKIVHISKL
jgi:hypothetical protein